jgi:hypothetical protein
VKNKFVITSLLSNAFKTIIKGAAFKTGEKEELGGGRRYIFHYTLL